MLISKEHDDFLQSIINDIESILCDCNCECADCKISQEEYNDILVKIILFYSKYFAEYEYNLIEVFNCLNSTIDEEITCLLLNEKIKGKFKNTDYVKGIVSYFYIGFYNKFANDVNFDSEEIKTFFKYVKINKCINKNKFKIDCFTFNNPNPE